MPLSEADFARLQSELIHLKQENYDFKAQAQKATAGTVNISLYMLTA